MTPAVRFKGFTDPWEQRKLGELVQFSKGTGYSKGDLKESGTPIILYGRLYTQYETVISDVDTFVDAKPGSVYSRGEEVVVPASGETAEDISIASVVKKSGVLLGGDLNIITPHDDLDSAFLAISISNGKPHNDMAKMAQGKSVVHLHNTDLEKIDLVYPSHNEQAQISTCFKRIDNLITLHQRKHYRPRTCDLSSIFDLFLPHNTATWEQRKLRDVAEFNPRSELPDEFEYVDLESVVGTEMVSHRTEKKETAPSRAQRLAQSGDVFFQTVRPYKRNNYLFVKPDKNYVFSTGYAQMRPIIDASFLMCFLQTDSFVNVVLDNCTGTSYPAINSNDLSNLSIILPTNQEEQMQIGRMITNLDNLITLHQRKLEKLKNIKKSMLESMFV